MKRFRVLLALIVVLMSAIFCASLVACGDGDDGSGSSEKVVITYYIREDSAPLTVKVKKYEEYKFSLNSLKRNHYTFAGMYEGPNGSGSMIVDAKGKSTTVFMDDTTLYCYWTPSSYTLEFDAVDGVLDDAEKTKSVQYGSNVGLLPAPTLEGYNFDGWYIGLDRISNGSEVISGKEVLLETNYSFPESGNIVLTAKYSIKEYTVTFNYNDGRVENGTIKIEHGQPIPSDRYPQEDTGSKLLYAWSTSTNSVVAFTGTVTEDITLYAFWKNYKVFQFYDGIKSTSDTKKVFQNEPLTLDPLSNRDGYTFRGWYNNTLGNGDPITTVTYGSGSIKYYASWSINTYQITLNANGGACPPDPISYTIESEDFDLPVPERENYTFLGWCKKSDLSDAPITKIVKGTYELTQLYAKYKGETKTLILNACQGYVSQTRKLVEFGKTFSLPVPTLAEHVFIGWYDGEDSSANKITDSNGNGLAPLGFKPAETTLYAHYMKKLHVNVNVNLEPAGKTTVKEYYLEGDKVDLTATLNTGYNFLGWYQDGELVNDQLEYKFTMGATDTTLELKYEAKKYTVTLVPGDGASCTESSDEVTFGESYNLVVPTKQDYTFIGWKLGDKVITNTEGVSKAVWDYDGDVSLYAYFVIVEPNTIPVYDESTLLGMADNPSATYCLYSDVDMTGVTWTPFDFSGTFKGNGLSIKNLTVTSSSGALGVFKKLTGNISDVNFENLTVKSTSYNLVNVGGVCAEMTGGTIDKVTVSGSVTGDYCRLGGIVGYMTGGTLSNSTNKADLKTDTYETSNVFVGGLVGYQTGGTVTTCINYGKVESKRYTGGVIGYATTTSFVDLFNYGEVKGDYIAGGVIACFEKAGGYTISTKLTNYGKVSGKEQVGGVFGRFYDGWDQGYNGKENLLKLSNFSNNGTINGNNYVGGVIGYLNAQTWGGGGNGSVKVTITNINNVGDVTGKTYVGGLFGYAYSDTGNSSIENCASTADIKAEAFIGGLAGKLENIKLISCENEFSTVTATGYVLDGNTYYGYVGGYVGYGYYVEDCHNAVEIKYNEQGMYVGGIAGRTLARVVNCSNTADVIAEKSNNVGGIVGEIACNGGYEIAQLSNSGTIKGKDVVGGVIGRLTDNWEQGYNGTVHTLKLATISNSGNVTGNSYVGGIAGYVYAETWGGGGNGSVIFIASVLTNQGNVTGKTHVGGLLGFAHSDDGSSIISNSSSSADVTAEAYVGGLAGKLEYVKLVTCSNEDSTVTATGYILDGSTYYGYVGGYAGYGYYIEDCHNAVEISYTQNGRYVGGIAGKTNATIKNCTNTANVTATGSNYVGGIIGELACNGGYDISTLTNSGDISGKDYVAGIIGNLIDNWDQGYTNTNHNLKLMTIKNTGEITGGNYVGGIVGYVFAETWGGGGNGSVTIIMTVLTNEGDITGKTYVGGLVGFAHSDNGNSNISNSNSMADIKAEAYVGGLAGRLENVKLVACSNANSTVSATGYILDGSTYYGYVGGYVGYGYYIEDCHNAVEITYTEQGMYVGGIAGRINSTIKNSTNMANVTAEKSSYVGGLVGELACNGGYEISEITNSGNIKGNEQVGGLIGKVIDCWDQAYNSTTHNLKMMTIDNQGNVFGSHNVGGLIGYVYAETYGSGGNGSVLVIMSAISTSGNVTGSTNVGVMVGQISTDNSSSKAEYYTYSGMINGENATKQRLFANIVSNFYLGTEK